MADEKKVVDHSDPDVEREIQADRPEIGHAQPRTDELVLHEYAESEGYVIDAEDGAAGVKLAKDGHTRLIPQPSDDPKDPLNWSSLTKHVMLMIVALTAFLPDYGSATGAVTLLAQAKYVVICSAGQGERCSLTDHASQRMGHDRGPR